MIKLAIAGACGRMGRRLVALSHEDNDFTLAAALENTGVPLLGQDAGTIAGIGELGVAVTEDLQSSSEVMIDFTLPEAAGKWSKICVDHKVPLVVGTTGLGDKEVALLEQASTKIPVLIGSNMSLGVNLLFRLVAEVAEKLNDSYDIEIVEYHHRFKRDAPSGTALSLAKHIAQAKGWDLKKCLQHGREGRDALREENTIGMHAVRGGDIVGQHNITYSTLGETIELRHTATSRDTFVRGALHAAKWIVDKTPSLYSMFDVLGL